MCHSMSAPPTWRARQHPFIGGYVRLTMAAAYHFTTTWRVLATVDEVKEVLADGVALSRWWPAVYLDVRQLEEGGPDGVGRVLELHTKGWLPYTLRWALRITEPITDAGFALEVTGDLEGHGRWTFEQDQDEVLASYDWRVSATKPLLRRLGWLLRPAFSANHRWAMRRGEESLQLELRRRRASTAAELEQIPPPPPPTFAGLVRRAAR